MIGNYTSNNQIIYMPQAPNSMFLRNQNGSSNIMYNGIYNNNIYNFNSQNFNNIYQINGNNTKIPNGHKTKKKVRFNDNVDVTLIKSYKEYNR